MIKQMYASIPKFASHKNAEFLLLAVAFAESSFFPVPPDAMLIPMVIVNTRKAFWYAFLCTFGSVLGGCFGYFLGSMLFAGVGHWAMDFYGITGPFHSLSHWYQEYVVYIIMVAGFSPIPYKVFTILSGFMGAGMASFLAASIISRGARFFLIAWLLWRGGPEYKGWIETNFYPMTMALSILLIMGMVLVKYFVN